MKKKNEIKVSKVARRKNHKWDIYWSTQSAPIDNNQTNII